MTATAKPPAHAAATSADAPPQSASAPALARAAGIELLGGIAGSGYKEGAALVRRADGQMVQLGPLQYGLLESIDGHRDVGEIAQAMSERLGRRLEAEHVVALARKLAAQGLLEGTEANAPPKSNPLLALRWKVLVTNPRTTARLTDPFAVLFRPWVMWPVLVAFIGVFWFVLFDKGIASATAQAFHRPELLLLVFVLAVASAGFHELGHAAACRYGGATPGGMGMGIYLVWPAFYTEVTDSYRLPRRDRLRVDLGGLYFNAVVAVVTMAVWLAWRADALLLLVGLQVLQMVKQLSPIIRADGYHILSDATGVPDLYAHMGPTLRRLLPWRRREPTALTGRARLLVTVWVLVVVPVLLSLSLSAIVLLPRLLTSAWDSGSHIASAIPADASHGQIIDVLAGVVRLLALALPVCGSALVTQKILRTVLGKALGWSEGRPVRRGVVLAGTSAVAIAAVWAWWPAGQYEPVQAAQGGTIAELPQLVVAPASAARPISPAPTSRRPTAAVAPPRLAPGTHLAISLVPVGGATKRRPAFLIIGGGKGRAPVVILSDTSPDPAQAPVSSGAGAATTTPPDTTSPPPDTSTTATTPTTASTSTTPAPVPAAAFSFRLPGPPGPHGTQALAVNRQTGGVLYDVAYALVTVSGGANVDETNTAYALANCTGCTTVAVSFQIVLVVGSSHIIAPVNAAGALNGNCPACVTTAIADQIVVTLKAQPSQTLLATLQQDLAQLGELPKLGSEGTPAAVAAEVGAVQSAVQAQIDASGLKAVPSTQTATTTSTVPTTSGSTDGSSTTASTPTTTAPETAGSVTTASTPASTATTSGPATTTPATPSATTSTPTTTTNSTPSSTSSPSGNTTGSSTGSSTGG